MVGMVDWTETSAAFHAVAEAAGGPDRAGLITIIVVSVVAIITFVWIFRETGKRD